MCQFCNIRFKEYLTRRRRSFILNSQTGTFRAGSRELDLRKSARVHTGGGS